jgi:hypothetical protein
MQFVNVRKFSRVLRLEVTCVVALSDGPDYKIKKLARVKKAGQHIIEPRNATWRYQYVRKNKKVKSQYLEVGVETA